MSKTKPFIPETRALSVFKETAVTGSVREAAERLSMTSAAVSQTIRVLEGRLGVELFNRKVRPLELTAAGRLLLEKSEEILRLTTRMTEAIRTLTPEHLSMRVGLSESVSETFGPIIGKSLLSLAAHVDMRTGFTETLAQKMASDKLDIVISPESFIDAKDYAREALLTEDYLVVTPKTVPPPATFEDVVRLGRTLPYLRYNSESSDRLQSERLYRRLGLEQTSVVGVESSYTLVGLVALGQGWCLMPPLGIWQGRQWANNVNVTYFAQTAIRRTQWIVTKSEAFAPIAKAIKSEIETAYRKNLEDLIDKTHPGLIEHVRFAESRTRH
ncbi:MAG TPA: hypothetical protein DCW60_04115 [Sutterella sp.]|nr:hypothetical protein [Sutterella sp.]